MVPAALREEVIQTVHLALWAENCRHMSTIEFRHEHGPIEWSLGILSITPKMLQPSRDGVVGAVRGRLRDLLKTRQCGTTHRIRVRVWTQTNEVSEFRIVTLEELRSVMCSPSGEKFGKQTACCAGAHDELLRHHLAQLTQHDYNHLLEFLRQQRGDNKEMPVLALREVTKEPSVCLSFLDVA